MIVKKEPVTGAHLPYFYLGAYQQFCYEELGTQIILLEDEHKNTLCCKKWRNKLLNFLQPMYPPLNTLGERLEVSAEKSFLEELANFVRKQKITDRITQSPAYAIFHSAPARATKAAFGTYFIDLRMEADTLFKNLHGKHRNVIRNADKHGVEVRYGSEVLPDFYHLYRDTMQRSGMFCEPLSFFEKFCEKLSGHVVCGVAYYQGRAQGAVLMPYTSFGAFYLYGASADKIAVNGAMNLLHWKTAEMLKGLGVKRYDFVGARVGSRVPEKLKSIQQFKERFGCTLEKGYLWKLDIAPARCRTYDSLLSLKLKLKGKQMPLDMISQELQNHEED